MQQMKDREKTACRLLKKKIGQRESEPLAVFSITLFLLLYFYSPSRTGRFGTDVAYFPWLQHEGVFKKPQTTHPAPEFTYSIELK